MSPLHRAGGPATGWRRVRPQEPGGNGGEVAKSAEKNGDYQEATLVGIEHKADPEQFPDNFIIPERHEEGHCPTCDGDVETVDVSGRTAYYCPECQTIPDTMNE